MDGGGNDDGGRAAVILNLRQATLSRYLCRRGGRAGQSAEHPDKAVGNSPGHGRSEQLTPAAADPVALAAAARRL